MPRALIVIASIASLLALGCKGCGKKSESEPTADTPAEETPRESQAEDAKLKARVIARNIDRSKVYAKAEDGSVACGDNVDCFVLQAESCTKAQLKNTLKSGAYGIMVVVESEYRITGVDGEHCKMTRHVAHLEATLHPKMEEALRKQGKTDDDIAAIQADNERAVRAQNPALLDCSFDRQQALSVALDVAEGLVDRSVWRDACQDMPDPVVPAAPAPAK